MRKKNMESERPDIHQLSVSRAFLRAPRNAKRQCNKYATRRNDNNHSHDYTPRRHNTVAANHCNHNNIMVMTRHASLPPKQ